MYASVYDIKQFYKTRLGRLVCRTIQKKLLNYWSDVSGMTVVGLGYSIPYLNPFLTQAQRCIALMPANLGVHHWPDNNNDHNHANKQTLNLTALAEHPELPLETNSVDRVLLIHSMEYAEMLKPNLQEIYRILKSNGRLIVVIPNRMGLWAGSDKTPFGQGTPYTSHQLSYFLKDNFFTHERTQGALFMPPTRAAAIHQISSFFDVAGGFLLPAFAGVYIVEASKQIYAGISGHTELSRAVVRGRKWLLPKPAPVEYPKAN